MPRTVRTDLMEGKHGSFDAQAPLIGGRRTNRRFGNRDERTISKCAERLYERFGT
ncbi:hypothetical protein JCM15831A_11530 [Asaia astilbis]